MCFRLSFFWRPRLRFFSCVLREGAWEKPCWSCPLAPCADSIHPQNSRRGTTSTGGKGRGRAAVSFSSTHTRRRVFPNLAPSYRISWSGLVFRLEGLCARDGSSRGKATNSPRVEGFRTGRRTANFCREYSGRACCAALNPRKCQRESPKCRCAEPRGHPGQDVCVSYYVCTLSPGGTESPLIFFFFFGAGTLRFLRAQRVLYHLRQGFIRIIKVRLKRRCQRRGAC